jgi:hypothetical protein
MSDGDTAFNAATSRNCLTAAAAQRRPVFDFESFGSPYWTLTAPLKIESCHSSGVHWLTASSKPSSAHARVNAKLDTPRHCASAPMTVNGAQRKLGLEAACFRFCPPQLPFDSDGSKVWLGWDPEVAREPGRVG